MVHSYGPETKCYKGTAVYKECIAHSLVLIIVDGMIFTLQFGSHNQIPYYTEGKKFSNILWGVHSLEEIGSLNFIISKI